MDFNVCMLLVPHTSLPSDVTPVHQEVEIGTDATLSCVASGITKQLNSVSWKKGGSDVTSLSNINYIVNTGTIASSTQTTTLVVKAAVNTVDSVYTCVISSDEYQITDRETAVNLDVFGGLTYQFWIKTRLFCS